MKNLTLNRVWWLFRNSTIDHDYWLHRIFLLVFTPWILFLECRCDHFQFIIKHILWWRFLQWWFIRWRFLRHTYYTYLGNKILIFAGRCLISQLRRPLTHRRAYLTGHLCHPRPQHHVAPLSMRLLYTAVRLEPWRKNHAAANRKILILSNKTRWSRHGGLKIRQRLNLAGWKRILVQTRALISQDPPLIHPGNYSYLKLKCLLFFFF